MTAARQVLLGRLSLREELVHVIRAITAVMMLIWIYLVATRGDPRDAQRALLPYQALVQSQPPVDQRMFRELQEGLLEAETIRAASGQWPAPEQLASAGIPPFAPDPTAKGARYRWRLLRSNTTINYLGIPDEAGAPAWLLVVQEPQAGIPPDQPFEDEEHHKLVDGTMLHVAAWSHPDGSRMPPDATLAPQNEGWQQLYAVGPAAPAIMPP